MRFLPTSPTFPHSAPDSTPSSHWENVMRAHKRPKKKPATILHACVTLDFILGSTPVTTSSAIPPCSSNQQSTHGLHAGRGGGGLAQGLGVGLAPDMGNAMHAVPTQCKVLYVGNYLNPSFGPFAEVCCSIVGFFKLFMHS